MAETNQLLINYYKKEEMKKVKEMAKERKRLKEILKNVNIKYINKDEILELLVEDYDEEIEKYFKYINHIHIKEYILSVLENILWHNEENIAT